MTRRSWSNKNPSRIDPAELERRASDSIAQVQKQQPKVNALTAYLERRKNQNGFGEDFEYTLRSKGA